MIVDVAMPRMDGLELVARVAALPKAPPLVMTSAYPYTRAILDHPFLPQPFHPEQLVTMVSRVLGAVSTRLARSKSLGTRWSTC